MSKKKQLLIALVVGAIALVGNHMYIDTRIGQFQNKRYVTVLRAKKGIKAGTTLNAGLVDQARVPEEFAPKAKIDFAAKDNYMGQPLGIDVIAGDYILETSFTTPTSVGRTLSQQLQEKDSRAITIPVDDTTSFSKSLVTGDKVDVLYSFSMPFLKQKVTTVLLQSVPVISTGSYSAAEQELGEKGKSGRYSAVTLMLSARDAMRLTYARQAGSIQLLLRRGTDTQQVDMPAITGVQDILSANDKAMLEALMREEKQRFDVAPQSIEQLREQARVAIEQQKKQVQALGVNR